MSKLAELIGQAQNPISRAPKRLRETPVTLARERLLELEALLHLRDGFVALGGALVVRPSVTVAAVRGIEDWNQITLWRKPYPKAAEVLFFAEDRFGQQFGLHKDSILAFDPVTGNTEHVAFSLDRWAEHVIDRPEALGQARLAEWVEEHGPLSTTQRLQPRMPPGFDDDDALGELRVLDDVDLMRRYSRLHAETRKAPGVLPEGFEQWWWDTSPSSGGGGE
ncbi:MAG: hypothetical protein KDK70_32340 [Myxococcales bacterium]|nr:hypothetical protein [Myxococcales bacterium]